MSTEINDGGPAFPRPSSGGWGRPQEGMSLRDWFAGEALPRVIAVAYSVSGGASHADIAAESYRYADAMLAARTLPTK